MKSHHALAVLTLFLASPASAGIMVTGSFTFVANGQGLDNVPYEGDWSFMLPDLSDDDYFDLPVSSFSLMPDNIGGTIFDETNVLFQSSVSGGQIQFVTLGADRSASGIGGGGNDFRIDYNSLGVITSSQFVIGPVAPTDTLNSSGTFSVGAVVPEPASSLYCLSGLLGLAVMRRRRSR
ncbi:MAG: VPLPA-CTERM sorting domain-containing protein [Planctomycetota bacterium]